MDEDGVWSVRDLVRVCSRFLFAIRFKNGLFSMYS
nr:MAG TPA: hypothetical protein [Bacteriophage sp.]